MLTFLKVFNLLFEPPLTLSSFQLPYKPSTGAKGATGGRRANAPFRAHLQLDRTETQQGVREGSSTAKHGGHHY